MRAVAVTITPTDVRTYELDGTYRIGHYLERDKPFPNNRRTILAVYRVPIGTHAPLGRLTDEQMTALAEELAKPEAPMEVIGRYPMFEGMHIDLVDSDDVVITEKKITVLAPSTQDSQGAYVTPQKGGK